MLGHHYQDTSNFRSFDVSDIWTFGNTLKDIYEIDNTQFDHKFEAFVCEILKLYDHKFEVNI